METASERSLVILQFTVDRGFLEAFRPYWVARPPELRVLVGNWDIGFGFGRNLRRFRHTGGCARTRDLVADLMSFAMR